MFLTLFWVSQIMFFSLKKSSKITQLLDNQSITQKHIFATLLQIKHFASFSDSAYFDYVFMAVFQLITSKKSIFYLT